MKMDVFRKDYAAGYVVLVITAVSMFIPGCCGHMILIAESLFVLYFNRKFLGECVRLGTAVAKKITHGKR